MVKTLLVAGATALLFCAGTVLAGSVHSGLLGNATPSKRIALPPVNKDTLWDQVFPDGQAFNSQDFTDPEFPTEFDAQGADDFVVPAHTTWNITHVLADGYYTGGSEGPAISWNVTFYTKKLKKGVEVVKASCNVPESGVTDSDGQVTIPCAVTLKGGKKGKRYYVSVQAVMAHSVGGNWLWNLLIAPFDGTNPGLWKNPADGFRTGCTTYKKFSSCFPMLGEDWSFALYGTVS